MWRQRRERKRGRHVSSMSPFIPLSLSSLLCLLVLASLCMTDTCNEAVMAVGRPEATQLVQFPSRQKERSLSVCLGKTKTFLLTVVNTSGWSQTTVASFSTCCWYCSYIHQESLPNLPLSQASCELGRCNCLIIRRTFSRFSEEIWTGS